MLSHGDGVRVWEGGEVSHSLLAADPVMESSLLLPLVNLLLQSELSCAVNFKDFSPADDLSDHYG